MIAIRPLGLRMGESHFKLVHGFQKHSEITGKLLHQWETRNLSFYKAKVLNLPLSFILQVFEGSFFGDQVRVPDDGTNEEPIVGYLLTLGHLGKDLYHEFTSGYIDHAIIINDHHHNVFFWIQSLIIHLQSSDLPIQLQFSTTQTVNLFPGMFPLEHPLSHDFRCPDNVRLFPHGQPIILFGSIGSGKTYVLCTLALPR